MIFRHLMNYMANNLQELNKRIVHVAKLLGLLFRILNSGLVIEEHLMYLIEDDDVDYPEHGHSYAISYNLVLIVGFVFGLKNSEMSFDLISVVRRHLLYLKEVSTVEDRFDLYLEGRRLDAFLMISDCFYDFRVLF